MRIPTTLHLADDDVDRLVRAALNLHSTMSILNASCGISRHNEADKRLAGLTYPFLKRWNVSLCSSNTLRAVRLETRATHARDQSIEVRRVVSGREFTGRHLDGFPMKFAPQPIHALSNRLTTEDPPLEFHFARHIGQHDPQEDRKQT